MTMSTREKQQFDQIVADAKDPAVNRDDVWFRASKLGHAINGDERSALTQAVDTALSRRPAGSGGGNILVNSP
jgi:hypothetical protein